jgi:hypothetical protein
MLHHTCSTAGMGCCAYNPISNNPCGQTQIAVAVQCTGTSHTCPVSGCAFWVSFHLPRAHSARHHMMHNPLCYSSHPLNTNALHCC